MSLSKFGFFFITLKRLKIQNVANPKLLCLKIIINIKILKFGQENFYSIQHFETPKKSQFETNVTLHDIYCQRDDGIFKIKSIFNYKMPYPNIT